MTEARDLAMPDALDELLSIYAAHVRALENDHWGEYVAVSSKGETLIDSDYDSLFRRASQAFGTGISFFRVGDVAVGNVRWFSR